MKPLSRVLITLLLAALVPVTATQVVRAASPVRHQPPVKALPLTAVSQRDGILLRWRTVAGCDGYRVYHEQGTELKPDSLWFDVDGAQTTALFQEVSPGESYTFRVSAVYGKKEQFLSAPVTVRMKDKSAMGKSDTGK